MPMKKKEALTGHFARPADSTLWFTTLEAVEEGDNVRLTANEDAAYAGYGSKASIIDLGNMLIRVAGGAQTLFDPTKLSVEEADGDIEVMYDGEYIGFIEPQEVTVTKQVFVAARRS
jgi:hypothetical protein